MNKETPSPGHETPPPNTPGGRSPLVLIFTTVLIDLIGFGIVIPVLPLYAERFGATAAEIGFLLAIYSVMQFIFSPILGRLSDRVGRRPVLLVSLIGTALGFVLTGMAHTLWLLFLARIIDGISGGNISTAQAYIADVTPPEKRSQSMGLIGAAFGLGFIIGPAIGGLLSYISLAAPFYFAAGLSLTNALAVYARLPESLSTEHRGRTERVSLRHTLTGDRQLTAIIGIYFVATFGFSILTATYALFTHLNIRFGYDATHNGYIFAGIGVLGAAIQGGLIGRLIRAFGEQWLVFAGAALMAASLFALPFSATLFTLLLATAGLAVGNSLVTPTLNGLASRSTDEGRQGRVLGVMQSGGSLGRILGPILGGWLLQLDVDGAEPLFGSAPYWTAGVIMTVAAALALTLFRFRNHVDETAK